MVGMATARISCCTGRLNTFVYMLCRRCRCGGWHAAVARRPGDRSTAHAQRAARHGCWPCCLLGAQLGPPASCSCPAALPRCSIAMSCASLMLLTLLIVMTGRQQPGSCSTFSGTLSAEGPKPGVWRRCHGGRALSVTSLRAAATQGLSTGSPCVAARRGPPCACEDVH
jgi:hypothetical protein